MAKQLTEAKLSRQDIVDNAIHRLLEDLAGGDCGAGRPLDWDIDNISEVREAVQGVIVGRLHLMTKMQFYPYIK